MWFRTLHSAEKSAPPPRGLGHLDGASHAHPGGAEGNGMLWIRIHRRVHPVEARIISKINGIARGAAHE